MKNKSFVLRLFSLCVMVAALVTYNSITGTRLAAEEAVQAAEAAAATAVAEAGTEAGNSDEASSEESASGAYKDGTYEGEAQGFGGPIRVSVTVSGGNLTTVAVLSHDNEDDAYYNMAEALVPQIMAAGGTAGVDTVSGATFSSNGILGAVEAALEQAV